MRSNLWQSLPVVKKVLHSFGCFECSSLFAMAGVKGRSGRVPSVVAAANVAMFCNRGLQKPWPLQNRETPNTENWR